jgi:starch phosphorylase
MKAIRTLEIRPALPDRLEPLREIAYNILWSWQLEAVELFRRLDRELWEKTYHNPVLLLGTIAQEKLDRAANDDAYLAHLERVHHAFQSYEKAATWFSKTHFAANTPVIAYFSAEFGLTECLKVYSGGLGILAGDHLKSASDLGVPLVGVGLMYQKGYFQQYLNADGWQQEFYPENDFYNLPIWPEESTDGRLLKISVAFPGRKVYARVWRVQVGRVPLLLLDTNIDENTPDDRRITAELYGGDNENRLRQEIILGIGGIRALRAAGIVPAVCHMNEGHSAFLGLERIRMIMAESNLSFGEALAISGKSTVFTTHTPVPAGIDEFPPILMGKYFGDYYPELRIGWSEFLAMGRRNAGDESEPFNMAYLALHLAPYVNGVSQLHGAISRRMWKNRWPGVPVDEVPIESITNGVNTRSWIPAEMGQLFDRYLGPDWSSKPADQSIWEGIDSIPDEELWRTHERRRERLVAFTRRRLAYQLRRRGARDLEIQAASEALDPEALTIGFARRFATYKRAALIFRDPERLRRILTSSTRPVQLIFAGKAHPADNAGKELIKHIVHFARAEDLRRRIVFLENYDITIARYLVQGVDVWLNNPRRPLEASGTSGMKVLFNGGLNLSVLDGWWVEGYAPNRGWAIGNGEEYDDLQHQDDIEASAIYDLLEKEIAPLYYDRGRDGLPRGWITKMKNSMRDLCPVFNTNRMVKEYTEKYYLPAYERYRRFSESGTAAIKSYQQWIDKVRSQWAYIRIVDMASDSQGPISVGTPISIKIHVQLGALVPDDVLVQAYLGRMDSEQQIIEAMPIPMSAVGQPLNGVWEFAATTICRQSGRFGYSARVLPFHPELVTPFEPGLICWANGDHDDPPVKSAPQYAYHGRA